MCEKCDNKQSNLAPVESGRRKALKAAGAGLAVATLLGTFATTVLINAVSVQDNGSGSDGNGGDNNSSFKIKLIFGEHELIATFEYNATTMAFREKLPVILPMKDLYSREMCYRFPDALPANEARTRG
jgi:hypothetical protein